MSEWTAGDKEPAIFATILIIVLAILSIVLAAYFPSKPPTEQEKDRYTLTH